MTTISATQCFVLPCTEQDLWVVPDNCLAEIVTQPADDVPPAQISWRGEQVPVLDLQPGDDAHWGAAHGGTGLIAVLLGLEETGVAYWGVVLRSAGLRIHAVPEGVDEAQDEAAAYALTAFRQDGVLYQIPDLAALPLRLMEPSTRH